MLSVRRVTCGTGKVFRTSKRRNEKVNNIDSASRTSGYRARCLESSVRRVRGYSVVRSIERRRGVSIDEQ